MKIKILVTLLLGSSLSAEVQDYNIDQLIKMAVQNNPSILLQSAKSAQSKAIVSQSTSDYFPQLSISALGGYQGGRTPAIQNEIQYDETTSNGEVEASQLIYDFGKTGGRIYSAGYKEEAQKFNEHATLNSTVNDVYQNYYTVLEKKHLVVVQEESLKLEKFQYYEATEYFKAGVKSKIDVTNAQVSVSTAKLSLIQARFDYKLARVALENVLGIRPNRGQYLLVDNDTDIDTMMQSFQVQGEDLEALNKKASKNRPELNANKKTIEANEEEIVTAKGDYFPRLDAVGKYNKYFEKSEFQSDEQYSAMLRLQWNLFSGLDTQSQVQEQRSIKLQNQATLVQNSLNVRQEVTTAYLTSQEYVESLQVNYDTVQFSTENLEQAKAQYKQGIGDYLQYNDAQVQYISAKTNFLIAYFNYKKSLAQISYTTGDLGQEYY